MTQDEAKTLLARINMLNAEAKSIVSSESGDISQAEAKLTEIHAIQQRLEVATKTAGIDSYLNAPRGGVPQADAQFVGFGPEAGYADVQHGQITAEAGEGLLPDSVKSVLASNSYKSDFQHYIRSKGDFGAMGRGAVKTIMEGADGYGGFWVPEDWQQSIIQKKPAPISTADFCRKLTTARDAITMPVVKWTGDDIWTTGMRMKWTGEVPATSTTARVAFPVDATNGFGTARIPVYTAMLSLPLTENQIEDTGFDISGWASDMFREAVDLGFDNLIVNGTGIGQPTGLLAATGSAVGQIQTVHSGDANNLTADGILKLFWGTPPQYEDQCRYYLNKVGSGQQVALLKDTTGRYLWGMGLQDNGLEVNAKNRTIAGYPVTWNVFLPSPAAGAIPVYFGDMRAYYIVNRSALSIRVLNELYAESNQVLLLGRLRAGGQPVENWRLRAQLIST
jgi:HK97 family phage major capsid protein